MLDDITSLYFARTKWVRDLAAEQLFIKAKSKVPTYNFSLYNEHISVFLNGSTTDFEGYPSLDSKIFAVIKYNGDKYYLTNPYNNYAKTSFTVVKASDVETEIGGGYCVT